MNFPIHHSDSASTTSRFSPRTVAKAAQGKLGALTVKATGFSQKLLKTIHQIKQLLRDSIQDKSKNHVEMDVINTQPPESKSSSSPSLEDLQAKQKRTEELLEKAKANLNLPGNVGLQNQREKKVKIYEEILKETNQAIRQVEQKSHD